MTTRGDSLTAPRAWADSAVLANPDANSDPATRHTAALVVVSMIDDPDDARDVLYALGLLADPAAQIGPRSNDHRVAARAPQTHPDVVADLSGWQPWRRTSSGTTLHAVRDRRAACGISPSGTDWWMRPRPAELTHAVRCERCLERATWLPGRAVAVVEPAGEPWQPWRRLDAGTTLHAVGEHTRYSLCGRAPLPASTWIAPDPDKLAATKKCGRCAERIDRLGKDVWSAPTDDATSNDATACETQAVAEPSVPRTTGLWGVGRDGLVHLVHVEHRDRAECGHWLGEWREVADPHEAVCCRTCLAVEAVLGDALQPDDPRARAVDHRE